ncbi:hypothetical protein EJK15_58240 [Nonomuraea basaltis]|nr:hypothetical protein EJK15_58240 [Nonomuraea basaltis]
MHLRVELLGHTLYIQQLGAGVNQGPGRLKSKVELYAAIRRDSRAGLASRALQVSPSRAMMVHAVPVSDAAPRPHAATPRSPRPAHRHPHTRRPHTTGARPPRHRHHAAHRGGPTRQAGVRAQCGPS